MQEERFDRIDQALREIHQRFDGVDGRFDGVEKRLDGVDGRLDDIKRDMHLLHEDAIERIAATREYSGPTKEEFAELKELIGRRLDPLAALGRDHEGRIRRLETRRR